MISNKTHYSYLRDPNEPRRVVTVASRIEKGVIYVGMAVNTRTSKNSDDFEKKYGRKIAESRMNSSPIQLRYLEKEHPLLTVSRFVLSNAHYGRGAVFPWYRSNMSLSEREQASAPSFLIRTFTAQFKLSHQRNCERAKSNVKDKATPQVAAASLSIV